MLGTPGFGRYSKDAVIRASKALSGCVKDLKDAVYGKGKPPKLLAVELQGLECMVWLLEGGGGVSV